VGAKRPDLADAGDSRDAKNALPKLTDAKTSVATSRYQLQRLQPTNHAAAAAAAADPAHARAALKAAATNGAGQSSSSPDIATITAPVTQGDGNAVAIPGNALFGGGAMAAAAVMNASAVTPAATYAMHAPVASAAWQQDLGQQLVQLVQRGTEQIDLHLNPRELGPLQISLQLHDRTAQVQFLVAHADVHNAVQQAIPQLREVLAGQGIALGQALVGQQQQQSSGSFGGDRNSSSWTGSSIQSDAADPVGAVRVVTSVPAGGDVDLYA
ncbi:MAG: flagellar hook-length control protein FliK, partial [Rhodanobacteraceae bacterium]